MLAKFRWCFAHWFRQDGLSGRDLNNDGPSAISYTHPISAYSRNGNLISVLEGGGVIMRWVTTTCFASTAKLRPRHTIRAHEGSYQQVREYVAAYKKQPKECFVPHVSRPGGAQADFFEAVAEIAGIRRKAGFDGCAMSLGTMNEISYQATLVYDGVGNNIGLTRFSGDLVSYQYDLLNRVTTVLFSIDSKNVSYVYDPASNLQLTVFAL